VLKLQTKLPKFEAAATGGPLSSDALAGKPLVIYFYPKDNTSGCTAEATEFGAKYKEFAKAGANVVGVSRDSLKSHENFKAKLGLPFALISDADEKLCERFGVIKMKTLYGKPARGIERSTFVFGAGGALAREWRGVKVPGHVDEVLAFVKSL
jgi:peroxiredoxin Q/BCP